jgi:hypothetical protein
MRNHRINAALRNENDARSSHHGGTVDELMEWWIEKFLKKAGSDTGGSGTQSR